ncbi:hypothetical protein B0T14DRAFT_421708, partial [Immersiella caudata]
PITTDMTRCILSLMTTTNAVACSAALPTMGINTKPMNLLLRLAVWTKSSALCRGRKSAPCRRRCRHAC